jgi:glycosyltransferase involved in cell wall biosynthesis
MKLVAFSRMGGYKMISIIVPVYNTEKYLHECLESILSQSYIDIEVILVDDGSTDNSLTICQYYAEKDKRVKVYHKENSGVSDTRNYGIKQACGEYISFCDSDDKIASNLYQILYEIMEKYEVDRVISGYAFLYENGRTLYSKPRMPDGKYEVDCILPRMIDDGTLSGFLFSGVNNSLFKKKIIQDYNIEFDSKIKYNEDSLFSFKYMIHSKAIYSVQSKATYYYRQHENSSTKKRTVGDKYKLLRQALIDMKLDKDFFDFDTQMKRRIVTEALWQVLDIAEKENGIKAIQDIYKVLNAKSLKNSIDVIDTRRLNKYKRFYYILMKNKMAIVLYFLSRKVLPILSKYLSR